MKREDGSQSSVVVEEQQTNRRREEVSLFLRDGEGGRGSWMEGHFETPKQGDLEGRDV